MGRSLRSQKIVTATKGAATKSLTQDPQQSAAASREDNETKISAPQLQHLPWKIWEHPGETPAPSQLGMEMMEGDNTLVPCPLQAQHPPCAPEPLLMCSSSLGGRKMG